MAKLFRGLFEGETRAVFDGPGLADVLGEASEWLRQFAIGPIYSTLLEHREGGYSLTISVGREAVGLQPYDKPATARVEEIGRAAAAARRENLSLADKEALARIEGRG